MNHVANPFVVVLDANVLYPYRMRDILFTFAHQGLFRARFTKDIIDEWTRNLIADKPDLKTSVEKQATIVAEVFDECFVEGYEPLIAGLNLKDPDDRHVLAAAIKCSAQIIVTENRQDFSTAEASFEPVGPKRLLWLRSKQRRHLFNRVYPLCRTGSSPLNNLPNPVTILSQVSRENRFMMCNTVT